MMADKPVDLVEFEDRLRFSPDAISVEERERMLARHLFTYLDFQDPGSAPLWLHCAASIHQTYDHHTQCLSLFYFSRLAQLSPGVEGGYRELAQATANASQRAFICAAAQLAVGDFKSLPFTPEENFPNSLEVLAKPVRHPSDLDYLWMEFFLTGNEAALRKIIEVLVWPDRTRARLRSAFANLGRGIFWFRRRFVAARLQRLLGIAVDRVTGEVHPDIDLDVYCALQPNYQWRSSAEFAKIRAALPFQFSQDEFVQMATRFSACWSLISNLRHQRVRDTYDAAAEGLEIRSRVRNAVLTARAQAAQAAPEADGEAASGSSLGEFTVLDWENYRGRSPVTIELVLKIQAIAAGVAIFSMHAIGAAGWVTTLATQYEVLAWIALPIMIGVGFVAAAAIQLWSYLLIRAGMVPAVDRNGKHVILYLGDVPTLSWSRSPIFYMAVWPLIMSLYTFAAGLGASLIPLYLQGIKYSPVFMFIFMGQWLLSFVPSVMLARRSSK